MRATLPRLVPSAMGNKLFDFFTDVDEDVGLDITVLDGTGELGEGNVVDFGGTGLEEDETALVILKYWLLNVLSSCTSVTVPFSYTRPK